MCWEPVLSARLKHTVSFFLLRGSRDQVRESDGMIWSGILDSRDSTGSVNKN